MKRTLDQGNCNERQLQLFNAVFLAKLQSLIVCLAGNRLGLGRITVALEQNP